MAGRTPRQVRDLRHRAQMARRLGESHEAEELEAVAQQIEDRIARRRAATARRIAAIEHDGLREALVRLNTARLTKRS